MIDLDLRCDLAEDQIKQAMALTKGDKVTVKGKMVGKMILVHMKDCQVLK